MTEACGAVAEGGIGMDGACAKVVPAHDMASATAKGALQYIFI